MQMVQAFLRIHDEMPGHNLGKYGFVNGEGEAIVSLAYELATWFFDVGFVKGLIWIAFDKDGNQRYIMVADKIRQAFNGYAKLAKRTEQGKK